MKKFFYFVATIMLMPFMTLAFLLVNVKPVNASGLPYNPSYLISDKLFNDVGSMSPADIQTFLNSFNSGIKNLTDVENCNPPTAQSPDPYASSFYPHCGQTELAATLIYDAAQTYGVSPRVVLATMQKEESLVTDPNPSQSAINTAMGYGCPNTCDPRFQGFFTQLDWGTYQLRTNVELMSGRNWWGLTPSSYSCSSGPNADYSGGLFPGQTVTFYDPGGVAQTITLANASTASLYCYTPFVGPSKVTGYSGSYNFVQSFEQWWGSVSSPCYNDSNLSSTVAGERVLPVKLGLNHTDNFALNQPNNTGTACLENYIWKNGTFSAWQSLTASITPVVNPANGSIISADLNGDGVDELYLIDYSGTGSGRLEVHGWTPDLQGWQSHIATNSPTWNHSDAEVIACDPAGYGHDNLFLVEYRNTSSGDIEIHEWAPGLQQWVNHWDTHYGAVSPQNVQIVCGDLVGIGKDQFYYVQYAGNTGSGKLEVHGGITNLGYNTAWPYASPVSWPVHTAAISGPRTHWEGDTASSADDSDLIMADTVGNGVDRPYIIQYHGTASGRVEIYQMSNDFKNWVMLTATNQGSY